MRPDVTALADPTLQSRVGITITLYPDPAAVGPADLLAGIPTGGVDLTPFAGSVHQTDSTVTIQIAHRGEFDGANRPRIGACVSIRRADGVPIFNGLVGARTGEQESRASGSRHFTLMVSRRDSLPWWRDVRRCSGVLGVGADLAALARAIAGDLGLGPDEIDIPDSGVAQAHLQAQLGDQNAWDMLTKLLEPGLRAPFVDARGVLRAMNRSIQGRAPDLVVLDPVVAELSGGVSRPPTTRVRVKYLSPQQAKVTNSNQGAGVVLANATLTLGYFKLHDRVVLYWSDDRRKRAEGTWMSVLSSINSGAFELGIGESQSYEALEGDISGVIECDISGSFWALDLAVAIGAIVASHAIPDISFAIGGAVLPVGRIATSVASMNFMRVLAHIGVGRYEVRGTTYDYVDQVNEVEAYDDSAPDWQTKVDEVQNDLIPNDEVAQSLAVNELLIRTRSNDQADMAIADDLRVEPGDVVGTQSGRRLYVQGYSRDLTRGSEATLKLTGFWL